MMHRILTVFVFTIIATSKHKKSRFKEQIQGDKTDQLTL